MKHLKSDTFLKITSLVIAIALWFYIVQVHDPDITKTFRNIPVVFSQIADLERKNLTLINDRDITVDIEIKGNRKTLMNISDSDITVVADVSTVERTGTNNVTTTVILPYGNLEVTNKKPSTIKINVDELCSKSINVKLIPLGEPKQGYVIGSLETTPEKIWVTGAETVVEGIDYIGAEIDVTEKSSDITTVVSGLKVFDSNNNEISSSLIKLDAENVNARCEILKIKNVKFRPIISNLLIKDGYLYEVDKTSLPTSINIKGSADIIDDITSVDTIPITVDDIDKNSNVNVKLNLPEGVSLFTGDSFTIKFTKKHIETEISSAE